MKKLLILSGKGGTGKTTTASAFIRFSGAPAFADCDVDAPISTWWSRWKEHGRNRTTSAPKRPPLTRNAVSAAECVPSSAGSGQSAGQA